ncbi:MAG: DUF3105 domain-containing protein [Nitrospinota bacterium]|nr:MAG: DUF3105 domain-containing protein [Nitrospinota bacterium]
MAKSQKSSPTEGKKQAKAQRREARRRARRKRQARVWLKKRGWYLGGLIVAGLFGYGVYTATLNAKVYPPTGIAGHVEQFPPQHILTVPIDEAVQKHLLEHGNQQANRPAILIQYNCRDCPELVAKLTSIARRYPDAVYLAPYPKMDARIALTTLGKLEVLTDFDRERVIKFIETYR